MFHLQNKYFCMFSATDALLDLLSEYDISFRKKIDNFIITDTIIYS